MKRRIALKQFAILGFGSLVSLPNWAKSWTSSQFLSKYLVEANEAILGEIVEIVIPETKTPGAKSLQIHKFIQRIVYDCYGNEAINLLENGIKATTDMAKVTYNLPFINCSNSQKKDIYLRLSNDEKTKSFTEGIKQLTIAGYTNSEYFLNNHTEYSMAPGFYKGCVPVNN